MFTIQSAAEWAAFGCFWTNGQICSATSRLIVHVSMESDVVYSLPPLIQSKEQNILKFLLRRLKAQLALFLKVKVKSLVNCHLISSVYLTLEIFQERIAAAFLERLVKWCENIKISDPLEEGCRLGPVVSAGQVRKLPHFL